MNTIPNRSLKVEWLCKFYKKCPGSDVWFYKKVIPAKVRLIYPQFALLNDTEVLARFIVDLHHRMPDSDINRAKYPLFIHSLFNLLPLYHDFHMDNHSFRSIQDAEAEQKERYLRNNPEVCAFANKVDGDHETERTVKKLLEIKSENWIVNIYD